MHEVARLAAALVLSVGIAMCAGCSNQRGFGGNIIGLSTACRALLSQPDSLPDATLAQPYVGELYADPSWPLINFSLSVVAGSLPPGIGIAAGNSAGRLEGTPTATGTYVATLHVDATCSFDEFGILTKRELDVSVAITVNSVSPLSITTTSIPDGTVGQTYSTSLQAAAGSGSLTWSLAPGSAALPAGLSIAASGVISGIPAAAGTFTFTAQVRDSASPPGTATRAFILVIAPGTGSLAITTANLPNGAEDDDYSASVQTTGGVAPLQFSISAGALPANVSLDATTGTLGGPHPGGGSHAFTVQVRDSGSPQQTVTRAYSILILEVTTAAFPDGILGQAYSQTLGVRGQIPPVTWSPAPGTTLPAGLTLSLAGILSGTPTALGQSFFCVEVTDSDLPPRADRQCYSFTVNALPAASAPTITSLAPASAAAGGASFALTVNGTNFDAGAEVRWNGAARATTFVSATQLSAQILAADIAAAAIVNVTVANPAPNASMSAAAMFTITAPGGTVGVTDLVSQSSAGVPANADSAVTGLGGRLIAISQNGNRVVFASEASNLDGPERGVFVRDMALGVTRRVSTTLANTTTDGVVGESVALSADGTVVAFESRASNHVPGDTFGSSGPDADVFAINTCIHVGPPVECQPPDWISVMPDGTEPLFGSSNSPSISASGRFVAFSSNAPLTGINTGRNQILLRDRQTSVTTMLSVDDLGNAGVADSFFPAISGNGRFIAFVSNASNLVANDTNGQPDVFVRDTCFAAPGSCTPGTTRVSVASDGTEALGNFVTAPPSINDDGRFVVFTSAASNLVIDDTNGLLDVFLRDRLNGTTTRVSLSTTGAQAFGGDGKVTDSGRYVAFQGSSQVLVYDTCLGAAGCTPGSFVVSRVPGGASANPDAGQPAISGDGRFVVFHSSDTSLLPGLGTAVPQIFRASTH